MDFVDVPEFLPFFLVIFGWFLS